MIDKFLYQSQEKLDGVNIQSFAFRNYNTTTGVWGAIDPLNDLNPRFGGMVYNNNDAVNWMDPLGLMAGTRERDTSLDMFMPNGEATAAGVGNPNGGGNGIPASLNERLGLRQLPGIKSQPQATISEYKPDIYDRWREGNIAQQMVYGTLDGVYSFATASDHHLGGAQFENYDDKINTKIFGLLSMAGPMFKILNSAPSVTKIMQSHVTNAARKVDNLGDKAFTNKQFAAIQNNPKLKPMFRGNRIDVMARKTIIEDGRIKNIMSNYTKGPDFINTANGHWWDMTTPSQWSMHVKKYGQKGTLLSTK